ncbi:ABC-type transport auxiliary lipoprotein family protein [Luteimonas sp. SX5]|uniref:ABC-type transport auxiliary lipoprotein family protein n=1 Tax=Luteimonas galliterrae TaxID=2940486 RepID=A0ABT0MIC4_9GAMM|nr:ABC-type transport auxiliary lipoprotein family protein [Luteimonas galliterrae]MCL1634616.1 ABC-type transport auxiliary lipoprotein family protein [Luteimonas galliterrae]
MTTGIGNRESGIAKRAACATFALLVAVSLPACSILGNGSPRDRASIYAPDPRIQADPAWPDVTWQLAIAPATASRTSDTLRIAVRPTPGEIQVYRGASWAKTPTDMLEDAVLRGLEDSGKIPAVARQGSGIAADFKLVMDLRRFEADYAGRAAPTATVEVNAKLLHSIDQQVVASRTFLATHAAASTAVQDAAASFEPALAQIARDIDGWVLTSGEAHIRVHGDGRAR